MFGFVSSLHISQFGTQDEGTNVKGSFLVANSRSKRDQFKSHNQNYSPCDIAADIPWSKPVM